MTGPLVLVAAGLVLVALALHDVASAVRASRQAGPCGQLCGQLSPFRGAPPAVCDLAAGHAGSHQDRAAGTTWTARR